LVKSSIHSEQIQISDHIYKQTQETDDRATETSYNSKNTDKVSWRIHPHEKTKTDLEVVNPERFEKLELVSLFFYFCACVCFAFLGLLTFGLSLSRFGGVWPFPVLPDLNISHTIAVCPGPPATLT
jgi:hypothetical protein